jgi:hypothetical protein
MDAPESEVLFRSKRRLEQSGRVHIDKPESGHVSFHSRMVQHVGAGWNSEPVCTREW